MTFVWTTRLLVHNAASPGVLPELVVVVVDDRDGFDSTSRDTEQTGARTPTPANGRLSTEGACERTTRRVNLLHAVGRCVGSGASDGHEQLKVVPVRVLDIDRHAAYRVRDVRVEPRGL